MPNKPKELELKEEINLLSFIFFIYGFVGMAWIPRFPEVKAFLGLTNGQFGTVMSTATLGALASLFSMGHVIHKVGSKKILLYSQLSTAFWLILILNFRSTILFVIGNIIVGFSISAYHLSANAHAFNVQDRTGGLILTRFHGMWALGVVSTALLSGILVEFVSLQVHIEVLMAVTTIVLLFVLKRIGPALDKPHIKSDDDLTLKQMVTTFRIDWLPSLGLLAVVLLEWSTSDWATIYTREEIGMRPGLAALPYVVFMAMMILGRLNGVKISAKLGNYKMIRDFSLFGSVGFLVFIWPSHLLRDSHQFLAFILTLLAFACAGLGCSTLAAAFLSSATSRSKLPNAVVVGQAGILLNSTSFFIKSLIAWVAQWTGSLAVALTIPALVFLSARVFSKVVKEK
jgi:MFS family permease